MPITIDEFEHFDSTADESEPTNAERIVQFLVQNREHAYTATEIANATGIAENPIHPTLHRLEDRDLVRYKEPYWAIGDPEHVRVAFMLRSTTAVPDEPLSPENREAWLAAGEKRDTGDEV